MTREEIEALFAIAEQHDKAAPRGPFRVDVGTMAGGFPSSCRHVHEGREYGAADGMSESTARFLAAAREGWPALAKAARELLDENAQLRAMVDRIDREAI